MTTAGSVTALLQDAAKRSSSTNGEGSDGEQLIAVPAGLLGGFLASLAGKAIGGAIGGGTGEAIGGTAGGILGGILPFSVIPSGAPVSAKKAGGEDLVAVPAGFFGSLIKSIGGTVGDALGGDTGRAIGDVAGNVLGDILPFSVIPSGAPVSAKKAGGEDLVAVPAGFFGSLIKSIGGTVGGALGGDTGRAIGDVAGNVLGDILPFSVIPSGAPVSAKKAGGEDLVAVPAGFFGSLIKSIGGTVGGALGGDTGRAIGDVAGNVLGDILPFSVIPSGAPVSAKKAGGEDLVAVPAGFFGSLIKSIGGTVGDALGGDTGRAIGDVAGNVLGDILPFSVIPSGARSN